MQQHPIIIKNLGQTDYQSVWQAMRDFTDNRTPETVDELWLVEHPPVYTQGQAGKPEHLLNPGQIPVVKTDRGGQITYHGPGQLVAYPLVNIKRAGIGIKKMVCNLEQSIIDLLAAYQITAARKENAPGVYVDGAKVASIGLRIRKGCSYHGLSLNVSMDLSPFNGINPCGFKDLAIVQTATLGGPQSIAQAATEFSAIFCRLFNFQVLQQDLLIQEK